MWSYFQIWKSFQGYHHKNVVKDKIIDNYSYWKLKHFLNKLGNYETTALNFNWIKQIQIQNPQKGTLFFQVWSKLPHVSSGIDGGKHYELMHKSKVPAFILNCIFPSHHLSHSNEHEKCLITRISSVSFNLIRPWWCRPTRLIEAHAIGAIHFN